MKSATEVLLCKGDSSSRPILSCAPETCSLNLCESVKSVDAVPVRIHPPITPITEDSEDSLSASTSPRPQPLLDLNLNLNLSSSWSGGVLPGAMAGKRPPPKSPQLALLLVACLAMHLGATTYYVAKTGSNSNPGTEAEPWLTFYYAAHHATSPGDTVWVKQGTYDEFTKIETSDGTALAPIVFKSYDGWNTILTTTATQHVITFKKSYLVLDGFRIKRYRDYDPIRFDGANSKWCTVRNCDIEGSPESTYQRNGIFVAESAIGAVIDNNRIHDHGYNGHGHGIYMETDSATITNNIIYDNAHFGIQLQDEEATAFEHQHNEIAYNTFHGNHTGGIYVQTARNWIHHNLILDNYYGVLVGGSSLGDSNMIENNVIYRCERGLVNWHNGRQYFRNNIVAFTPPGASTFAVQIADAAVGEPWEFDYNCYYPDGDSMFYSGGYKDLAAWKTATGRDTHSIVAAPLFVDTAGLNFRLQAGSPCIDAGDPTTPEGFDLAGVATPQRGTVDIGAYELRATSARTWDTGHDVPLLSTSSDTTLAVAPNPVSGGFATVRYNLPEPRTVTIDVFNISGRLVQSSIVNRQSSIRLDLRSVPAGVYLVRVTSEGVTATQKLVVQR
jgi:hypothetical protein